MEQLKENALGTKSELSTMPGQSNSERNSKAEDTTLKVGASTWAGNLALERDEEQFCDRCDDEERWEFTHDSTDEDRVDPEWAETE